VYPNSWVTVMNFTLMLPMCEQIYQFVNRKLITAVPKDTTYI